MTTRTIVIPSSYIDALRGFIPRNKKTPSVLNGICLDIRQEGVFLVATDRHVLGAIAIPGYVETDGFIDKHLIPSDVIDMIPKGLKKREVLISVRTGGDHPHPEVIVRYNHGESRFMGGAFGYPDWLKIVPTECNGKFVNIDYRLTKPFYDAAKILDGGKYNLLSTPHRPMVKAPDGTLVEKDEGIVRFLIRGTTFLGIMSGLRYPDNYHDTTCIPPRFLAAMGDPAS